MVEIEIDGKKLLAKPNQTVIQVADEAKIYIPRFCYHQHLSIPANCRMCLVEVEKSPKTVPACATPVVAGMKVWTQSQKTIEAQRSVMEYLLINHPLDCPICDQGGECELQDLSMGFGSSHSEYEESKRCVADEDLGPLIATDMTRCIQCTRCVRFGEEVAGLKELGVMNRGELEAIQTYVKHTMVSEISGNIIDLCPVGALTSKPYRFTARPWELDQTTSISPHDCMGSNLHVHTRYGKVMRVVAREHKEINATWISDRDRFSYTGLYHPDRLEEPMVKVNGEWQVVDWPQALESVVSGLNTVIAEHGADKLGALVSPSATVEECYLLQKLIRGLGSSHIDHRLRAVDVRDQEEMPLYPGLSLPFIDLENCDAILLIGTNLPKELPVANIYVRKAAEKGATVIAINSVHYDFNFPLAQKIMAPHLIPQFLTELNTHFEKNNGNDEIKNIVESLKNKSKVVILLGAQSINHPESSVIRQCANKLSHHIEASIGLLTEGANAAGAWIAGAIPHRQAGCVTMHHVGLDAFSMLHKPRKAYVLMNVEPEDCASPGLMQSALKQADCVIALSFYRNPLLEQVAHVILPMCAFTETYGTYVNANGNWQSFDASAKPFSASRPAWEILCELGKAFGLEGFEYEHASLVRNEVKELGENKIHEPKEKVSDIALHPVKPNQLSRIGEIPIYAVDSLVRHAIPLQKIQPIVQDDKALRLHPDTASLLHVQEGDMVRVRQGSKEIQLPLILDNRIAYQAAWIAGSIKVTQELGGLFDEVEIHSVGRS